MKRICIDIRHLTSNPSGVGRYIKNLAEQLLRMKITNQRYYLLGQKDNFARLEIDPALYTPLEAPYPAEKHPLSDIWFNTFFFSLMKKNQIQIFHSTAFIAPYRKGPFALITTIHDFVYKTYPATLPATFRYFLNSQVKTAVKNSRALIVMSNFIKNQLEKYFNSPPPVRVIPLGCTQTRVVPQKGETLPCSPYMLFVGNIEPRKGIPDLIRGYEMYRQKNPSSRLNLVICGQTLWNYDLPRKMASQSVYKNSIFFTGYVPEEQLEKYYAHSVLTVIPSHYEGFGLPVLEALRASAPILVNDIAPLTETGGNWVTRVNITSETELAQKIDFLTEHSPSNPSRAHQYQFLLTKYSWEQCAKNTAQLYEEIN
ncbi:MAG: glycosyltransferase family 4 protein [Candidatus Aureabacteria bacterium]|nr:glycosyltransferase family 4 protein [Candidatus Auribacterota bacterium]